MIFNLCEEAKEWLVKNSKSMYQEMMESQQKALEIAERQQEREEARRTTGELEPDVFAGTPVTVEAFQEWYKDFAAEMATIKRIRDEEYALRDTRLTGKQIFEKMYEERAAASRTEVVDWSVFEDELANMDAEEWESDDDSASESSEGDIIDLPTGGNDYSDDDDDDEDYVP